MSNEKPVILADQEDRDKIQRELDKNILVEAAAGTGKTTSMLRRMVELIRGGKCANIRQLAAVTFTRKAAAELKSRFQVEIEKAFKQADGEEKKRLGKALENIEQCFVGTIHSFCGRILRERPVEANVDLAFEEADEETDWRVRQSAWEKYCADLLVNDEENIIEQLEQYGLTLIDLEGAFYRFADYPDVQHWEVPGDELQMPDIKPAAQAAQNYSDYMRGLRHRLPRFSGNDALIPKYKAIPRIISHYKNLFEPAQLMAVLEHFDTSGKIIQKEWAKEKKFTREDAKKELENWTKFREMHVTPLLNTWRILRYRLIIPILKRAVKVYDSIRHEKGILNFQDLLIKTAELLRDKPNVRAYFRKRFTHLLVDEFQDTDPVQAEVMFLLTADDVNETDWRKCKPSPGSLFVVGDPKQSIYRFRRADIITYNEVKRLIRESGGEVVVLSTNFRTTGSIIDWVNNVFSPLPYIEEEEPQKEMLRFNENDTAESPGYVALRAGRTDGNQGTISSLYSLNIPEDFAKKANVVEYEPELIARFIRYAIDTGITVSRTDREIDAGKSKFVDPSDFMILTWKKEHLGAYAKKLQDYGIPHQITGGNALNEVDALKLLHVCLKAVIHPENPAALVACLRSGLFGVSDAVLYRFKKKGGKFAYTSTVPEGLDEPERDQFKDIFNRLTQYSLWFSKLPALTAIGRTIDDLGLMAYSSAQTGGDVEAGSLAKAVEIIRSAQTEMWTTAGIVEYLGQLTEHKENYDGITAFSRQKPVVRVMNLHKAKGLEAPVVFLANPFGEMKHPPDIHIDRAGDDTAGYLAIYKTSGYGRTTLIAHPQNWEERADKEYRFLQAEKLRLRYVAATRAGSAMVITQQTAKKNKHYNPWQCFEQYLFEAPLLTYPEEPPETEVEEFMMEFDSIESGLIKIMERASLLRSPSYGSINVKKLADSADPAEILKADVKLIKPETTGMNEKVAGDHPAEWGSVIHALLDVAMCDENAPLIESAGNMLMEND
ncbi:MAG: AAA family ATPase, partial [candidate division Zixibacteria bacterium]|nr:AAA family ATPase [candidate division Zixibacteria bacterium]